MSVISEEQGIAARLQACSITDEPHQQSTAGYEEVLDALREILIWPSKYAQEGLQLGLRWPRGCLLHGPAGVGKTSLVQAVAAEASAAVFPITAASVTGAFLGESERRLRESFEQAQKAADSGQVAIVFLDEVDALCPRRGGGGAHESRVVAQLLTLLDGASNGSGSVVRVVAATNRPNALDPALRRPGRLHREIYVPPPTQQQRHAILALRTRLLPLNASVSLAEVAQHTHGYTAADLAAVVREAAMLALFLAADSSSSGDPDVRAEHFATALQRVKPSLVRGLAVHPPPLHWDDIGGLHDVKHRLKQNVEWPLRHRGAFETLGIKPPRGVLLHGPPGCSKTSLARAVATSSHANMIPLPASSLYSMYLGESEAQLRAVFKQARLCCPSIIFLDEVDALFAARSSGGSGGSESQLLSVLLTEMDGLELASGVLVLAATNRPDQLDAALMRPGRLDALLYVPPPDRAGRLQTLQIHCRDIPLDSSVNLEAVADATTRFSGAELQHVCEEAVLAALQRSSQQATCVCDLDFRNALQATPAAMTEAVLEQYERWGSMFSR